jgi:hypothetical protein
MVQEVFSTPSTNAALLYPGFHNSAFTIIGFWDE